MRVLLPPDHPEQILLGTNFGLLWTGDGGVRWELVCEEALATGGENVTQYLLAAPPAETVYALSSNQMSASTDRGCSWIAASGAFTDPFFTDSFADPVDPARVLALALVRTEAGWLGSSLFESRDGGHSFGASLYQAEQGLLLTGVESAAGGTLYLTGYGNPGGKVSSFLARSSDSGRTFEKVDLLPALGSGEPRLAAVDPVDPKIIFFRVVGLDSDRLAISRDRGDSAKVALALQGQMTAFLRRADGTVLVGTKLEGGFLSRDGGATFVPWPEAPHLRALGERAGVLYAVADNAADGFALGSSSDGGKSWTALLRLEHICGIRDCSASVRTTCQPAWQRLVDLLGITGCPAAPADASVGGGGGGRGCRCELGRGRPAFLPLLPVLWAMLRPAWRRRSSSLLMAPGRPRRRPGCAPGPAGSGRSARW
jgi:hypothetical protein